MGAEEAKAEREAAAARQAERDRFRPTEPCMVEYFRAQSEDEYRAHVPRDCRQD